MCHRPPPQKGGVQEDCKRKIISQNSFPYPPPPLLKKSDLYNFLMSFIIYEILYLIQIYSNFPVFALKFQKYDILTLVHHSAI